MHILIIDILTSHSQIAYIAFDTTAYKIIESKEYTDYTNLDGLRGAINACDVIVSHGAFADKKDLIKLIPQILKPWVCTLDLDWGVTPQKIVNMCKRLNLPYLEPFSAMSQCSNLLNCLSCYNIETVIKSLQ
jgi:hypothetical protein